MRSKVLIIILALVLGGLAAIFAATYLRSARTDIAAQNKPVEVLVATQSLPRGLTSDELVQRKLVERRKIPQQFVSADAISSPRAIENQVLAVSVGAGEQITRGKFAYPQDAGLSYSVPEDLVAISASIDDVSGVAGLIKPGDYVMVYATLKVGKSGTTATVPLIPRARVLAVGATTGVEQAQAEDQNRGGALNGRSANQGDVPSTVTLALTTEEAGKLTFAQDQGSTRMALLPANGSKLPTPASVSIISVSK